MLLPLPPDYKVCVYLLIKYMHKQTDIKKKSIFTSASPEHQKSLHLLTDQMHAQTNRQYKKVSFPLLPLNTKKVCVYSLIKYKHKQTNIKKKSFLPSPSPDHQKTMRLLTDKIQAQTNRHLKKEVSFPLLPLNTQKVCVYSLSSSSQRRFSSACFISILSMLGAVS